MELFKYLLIIWCLCGYVESFQLECVFEWKWCKAEKLKVLENDVAVTSVSGPTDVERNKSRSFWIVEKVETEIVPTKVCNFLQNLERFEIIGKKIKRINREAFTNCKKLHTVGITYTSLTTLPEDLFMDLIILEYIFINDNKLVSLPADLLLNNKRISYFYARGNKLQTIDTVLPSTMEDVNFRKNTCIDKGFPLDIADLELFKNEVASKCASSMDKEKMRTIDSEKVALVTNKEQQKATIESMKIALTEKETNVSKLEEKLVVSSDSNKLLQENLDKMESSLRSQANALNKTLAEKEEENEKLKLNMKTFESEKVALATNIRQQNSTTESLNISNINLKTEIEVLKKKNNQELSNVLEGINILKSNISNLVNTLTKKETNASKLEGELVVSLKNNQLLQENLEKMESLLRSQAIAFNKTLAEKEKEIEKLKQNKETCESEKVALATNITQKNSTIEIFKIEIEALKKNNTQEFSNVLEGINILKSNITNLVNTLTEKETNASKLEDQLFNCNQNNKLLQANLTQNDNFKVNETNANESNPKPQKY